MGAHEQDRIARNEAVFRDVNEAIKRGRWPGEAEPIAFRCECATLACTEMLNVTLDQYERVRADPRHFLLVPGHERPTAETVIERHPGYVIVEKIGEAAIVAEQLDPRT